MSHFEYLLKKYTNPQSRFLVYEGALIHYRIEGKGKPLVLLHGAFSSLHTFDAWVASLKHHYQVIRFDLPGFGLTGAVPSGDYSIPSYIRALNGILEVMQSDSLLDEGLLDTFCLAGNSLGGWIAWEYALAHPERVEKLVLLSASGILEADSVPFPILMARVPVFGYAFSHFVQRSVQEAFVKEVYCNQSLITKELLDRYYELYTKQGNPEAFWAFSNAKHQDNSALLVHLKAPTLILWGREDKWIPVRHAKRFHELIPHNRLLIYERVGHLPMEELPKQTADAMQTFLEE